MVCIDMVCIIITCIGIFYFCYVLHVLVYIGMYSKVICASIDMYWLECVEKIVCIVLHVWKKWYVLYVFVCNGMYLYVLLCFDLLYCMSMYGMF